MGLTYPNVLIVTRNVWDDKAGTSSTDTNLFGNYNPNALSQIYIESKKPQTKHCYNFFQISEYALIKRIWNKNVITGNFINLLNNNSVKASAEFENKEQMIMNHVRSNRSLFYSFAREILWLFNGWKSHEFKNYLDNNKVDVVFIYGSPLILMNRLQFYVLSRLKKPTAYYFMDDIYTYKSVKGSGTLNYVYKFFLRMSVRRVISQCQDFFVVSPKMKKEYDEIFNINSKILTKGIDFNDIKYQPKPLNTPLKIVYLGQIIYGRSLTLISMANALKQINKNSIKAQIHIYTGNYISKEIHNKLAIENTSFIMPLVPYEKVSGIMTDADIVVFAESLDEKYKNIARLSFSTKITDYLSSGKCIIAIGGVDVAPIEYLIENDAAIVITSEMEIEEKLRYIIENPWLINNYSEKSFICGKKNHSLKNMNELLYQTLCELSKS